MNSYSTNLYSNYPQYFSGYGSAKPAMPQPLPGKIVDSIDVAKVGDIPFGGYGIFPKADLSEVYIKVWNNNGTTNLITFKPTAEIGEQENEIKMKDLLEKIQQIETKLDELITPKTDNNSKRKELSASAY